jgi:hypothetical protein
VWALAVATACIIFAVGRFDFASYLVSKQSSFVSAAARSMDYWTATAGTWIEGRIDVLASVDPWLLVSLTTGFSVIIFTAGTVAAFKALR